MCVCVFLVLFGCFVVWYLVSSNSVCSLIDLAQSFSFASSLCSSSCVQCLFLCSFCPYSVCSLVSSPPFCLLLSPFSPLFHLSPLSPSPCTDHNANTGSCILFFPTIILSVYRSTLSVSRSALPLSCSHVVTSVLCCRFPMSYPVFQFLSPQRISSHWLSSLAYSPEASTLC